MTLRSTPLPLTRQPALWAAVLTAVSCCILFYLSPTLNKDAIIYLHAADAFKVGGWAAAEQAYDRPLYSSIIGLVSLATGMTSVMSAKLVSVFLAALASYAFVSIFRHLGYDRKTQLVAAAIILAYPGISSYRDYIVRDFGYWAFVFMMLSAAIRHHKTKEIKNAVAFFVFGGVATLFRPEAIVVMITVPVLSLVFSRFSGGENLLKDKALRNYLLLGGLSLVALYAGSLALNVDIGGKANKLLMDVPAYVAENFGKIWDRKSTALSEEVLNKHSDEYANAGLIAVYATIFTGQFINGLTWFVIVIGIYIGVRRNWECVNNPVYFSALIACAIPLVAFLFFKQFIQTRYMIILCLLVMIPLCVSLAKNIDSLRETRFRKYGALAIFIIAILDNHVSTGSSKAYVGEGSEWLNRNIETHETVASNNLELSYRTSREFDFNESKRFSITKEFPYNLTDKAFSFIAWQSRDVDELPELLEIGNHKYRAEINFINEKGDGIAVYRNDAL